MNKNLILISTFSFSLAFFAFDILRNEFSYKRLIIFLPSILIYIYNNRGKIIQMFSSHLDKKTLFEIVKDNDLVRFKKYIADNRISIKELSSMLYYGNVTLLNYTMGNKAYDIFKYLIEQNIDLNFATKYSELPLIYAVYSAKKIFIAELLKYKDKFDLYAKAWKFKANAIEIAVWRGRSKVVSMLLESGMKFSISEYNNTICGKEMLPFDKVSNEVKAALLRSHIFSLKKNQFNLHEKNGAKLISLRALNIKPYLIENFLLNS